MLQFWDGLSRSRETKFAVMAVGPPSAAKVALRHLYANCYLKRDMQRNRLRCENEAISEATTFTLESGATLPPQYKILNVTFRTEGLDKGKKKETHALRR